ncbi:MAG TPA: SDR family oxidoreductase [Thermoanaerobaculia bacterium]|nr:SDR family oxidoreductase [Thermoanaerobaculia bacterium]
MTLFDEVDAAPVPQRVLVTGGAGGLGQVIACRFHESGARVHLCDCSAAALAQALASHPGMHGTVADVARSEEVRMFVREACEWMGGVDVLVNCAGDVGPRAPIEEIGDDEWTRTVEVNLSGMFYCIREVTPLMRAQRSGAIVNIGSTSSRTGLPRRSAFVAAKAGVLGLTLNVARELGPDNVRCNAVLPGILDNHTGRELVARRARERRVSNDEVEADLLSYVSMRSWIEPEEVAALVVYLASPAARHVSGQAIGVCGNLEWER